MLIDEAYEVHLIALGGSASTGKTTCASELAQRLKLSVVVHVDDLSKEVGSTNPHFLDRHAHPWQQPAGELVTALIDWTAHLHPPIVEALRRLTIVGGIIEGEGIDPRLSRDWLGLGVKPLYIIELDRGRLWSTFAARDSRDRFLALSEEEQATVVEMNHGYNRWLRSAAEAANQPWVYSHPVSTLTVRCCEALGLASLSTGTEYALDNPAGAALR